MSESEEPQAAEDLAPFKIEGARSSRSKCKGCKRKIDKGALRLGVLIEGPFGQGYLWFHLKCAARRQIENVEEAYTREAWEPGLEVPAIEELRKLAEDSAEAKKNKREVPYIERAKSGRSKCKECSELIEKDSWRVIVLRSVEFYNQVRSGPIHVHPRCVAASVARADSATEPEGFSELLRANCPEVEAGEMEALLTEIGELD